MDEAKPLCGLKSEDGLLVVLTETIQGLEAVRRGRHRHNGTVGVRRCLGEDEQRRSEGGTLSPAGDEKEDERRGLRVDGEQEEKESERKVLGVLREMSVLYSGRLEVWRGALRKCASVFMKSPAGGGDRQHRSTTDMTECRAGPCSHSFRDTFLSVGEDVDDITGKLRGITDKLDAEIHQLSVDEASTVHAALQESRDPGTPERPEDAGDPLNSRHPPEPDSGPKQEVEDGDDPNHTWSSQDAERKLGFTFSRRSNEEDAGEVKGQVSDSVEEPNHCQTDLLEESKKDKELMDGRDEQEAKSEWITVGLTGQLEDNRSDVPDACFIRAPEGAAGLLRCEVADALSCLMVTGSEELISRVIRVKVQDRSTCRFPLTVAVPYCARYRGSCRDIAVKVVDEERRASYITPLTTEGVHGGQRGSFAEVKVYSLGLFAVVSCLKRENYMVPKRGLSLKLPMDPRISLNYLPGTFTAPVMAQTMIQPVDAVLLAAVKSKNETYRSVASTSPLLYLTHPTSQPLRRPLMVTLPCPPNTEQKRRSKENPDHQTRPVSVSPPWDPAASIRVRILGASVESKVTSNESLTVLGSKDNQWSILDKVAARNQQNGLVSFDLTESYDRLLVARLLSPLQPCHLSSLAEELEESVCCHSVTVVLQRRPDEPHAVLVAALLTRDLSWELSKLRAQGYGGPAEISSEISMCEADQLLLRFSGNVTSTAGAHKSKSEAAHERITFHSQRKNRLVVRLTEVDPFGNYSSPHYKGAAMFYRVARGQLEWRGGGAFLKDAKLLGDPVCKLSLTLPKKVRNINRPVAARVKLCEEADSLSDSLLLWLSGELSEEETASLVLSLRLRRSAAQLVKLRAGGSPSSRAFQVLALWRRGLPAVPHRPKAAQLARCLARSGRPDLAGELLLRQAAATGQSALK
ncbi:death domain-containing protein 1 isoform X2 [Mugil cephalus]|nr:death domain-containing protein 1 isoform X2 [Mugil cephalus]